jgi:hypothetical protein
MASEKQSWITLSMIQGYIAMWAVRQSPYHSPEGLLSVLDQFRASVRHFFDENEMRKMSQAELDSMLKGHLMTIPQFQLWNERKNGNQSPYGFVDRYSKTNPDNDFIDLGALTRNVRMDLFKEVSRNEDFDADFDQRWRRGWFMRFVRSWKYRLFPIKPCDCSPQNPNG